MSRHAPALPHLLRVASDAAGIDAVVALSRALGGKRIYIPKSAAPNDPLVLAAGQDAADAICRAIGGEHVEFPKGDAAVHYLIAEALVEKRMSANEMVAILKITYRHARRLRRQILRAKAGPRGHAGPAFVRQRVRDLRQIDIDDILSP